MSFRCAVCGEVSQAGQLVVRETREKDYTEIREEKGRKNEVVVGHGVETVREERLCLPCIEAEAEELAAYDRIGV